VRLDRDRAATRRTGDPTSCCAAPCRLDRAGQTGDRDAALDEGRERDLFTELALDLDEQPHGAQRVAARPRGAATPDVTAGDGVAMALLLGVATELGDPTARSSRYVSQEHDP
jgi:hypothetical protein